MARFRSKINPAGAGGAEAARRAVPEGAGGESGPPGRAGFGATEGGGGDADADLAGFEAAAEAVVLAMGGGPHARGANGRALAELAELAAGRPGVAARGWAAWLADAGRAGAAGPEAARLREALRLGLYEWDHLRRAPFWRRDRARLRAAGEALERTRARLRDLEGGLADSARRGRVWAWTLGAAALAILADAAGSEGAAGSDGAGSMGAGGADCAGGARDAWEALAPRVLNFLDMEREVGAILKDGGPNGWDAAAVRLAAHLAQRLDPDPP